MTTTVEEPPAAPEPPEPPEAPERPAAGTTLGLTIMRVISAAAIPIILFVLLWLTFDFLRDADANRFALAGVAIVRATESGAAPAPRITLVTAVIASRMAIRPAAARPAVPAVT